MRSERRTVAGAVALLVASIGLARPAFAFCVPSLKNCYCSYITPCPVKDLQRLAGQASELKTDVETLRRLGSLNGALTALNQVLGISGGNTPLLQQPHAFTNADPVPMRDVLTQPVIDKLNTGSGSALKDTEQRDAMASTLRRGDATEVYARAVQAKNAVAKEAQTFSEMRDVVNRAQTVADDWKANGAVRLALAQQRQDTLNLLGLRALLHSGRGLTPPQMAVAIQEAPAIAASTATIDPPADDTSAPPTTGGTTATASPSPHFNAIPHVPARPLASSADSTGTTTVGTPMPMVGTGSNRSGYIQANSGYLDTSGRVVGTGECAVLVEAVAPVGRTSTWRQGALVQGNANLRPGDAVATFSGGRYQNAYGTSHAAIYEGQNSRGLQVFDQYRGKAAGMRTIPWHHPRYPIPSDNNGVMYYVLTH